MGRFTQFFMQVISGGLACFASIATAYFFAGKGTQDYVAGSIAIGFVFYFVTVTTLLASEKRRFEWAKWIAGISAIVFVLAAILIPAFQGAHLAAKP